ncbi:MAG: aldo/keto reductase [Gemmatimonadetes bacterium]|nr:aldo/keto reductase [Gemmatimonadota bacterium]
MSDHTLSRREFVASAGTGAAALFLNRVPGNSVAGTNYPDMPERPLGRTGHRVRLFSLGGQAALEKPEKHDESIAIINRAIDRGVNYLDTAAAYGRGVSQRHLGEVMAARRKEVFLATKTMDRTRDGALRHLDESLMLLKTDHIDLWQLHNVRTNEEIDQIFARRGAIDALIRARDEKIVRFLGITGHYDPAPLMRGINQFEFDTILMALNAADRHRFSFADALLPLANKKGMGVIAMKIPARGRMFRPGGITMMRDAMRYTLSLPVSTVIVGCDTVAQLEENVGIAAAFEPLSQAEMARLESLTESYAADAQFFKRNPPA